MSVIYIKEQGSYLRLKGEQVAVTKGNKTLLEFPIYNIENIAVFGNVQVTAQVLSKLMNQGIDIMYFTYAGKYIGNTVAEKSKNIFLRFAQYEAYMDEKKRLGMARAIVENKIHNQINVIKSFHWEREEYEYLRDIQQMKQLLSSLQDKKSNNEVMGIEGLCSNIYFHCFRHMLKNGMSFEKRVRRPPRDPVNALLSLTYTFLVKDMSAVLEGYSFEMYLGFLHGIRYGRKSLALDMIEEWRQPVADRLVLRLFNKGMMTEGDFQENTGDGVFLYEDGFRKFCNEYERWMREPKNNGKSYRLLMKNQAGMLKKSLEEGGMYSPFRYLDTTEIR